MFDLSQSKSFLAELDAQIAQIDQLLARAQSPSASAAPPPPAPPPPRGGGTVVEPTDDQIGIVKQEPMGVIRWDRHRATFWAMPAPPKEPGAKGKKKVQYLIRLNAQGAQVLGGVENMNGLEKMWKDALKEVQAAAKQGEADLKKAKAAVPDMRKRRKKDPAFFEDIQGYTKAMDEAKVLVKDIKKAKEGLQKANAELQKSEYLKQANDKKNEIKDTEEAIEAEKQKLERAGSILKGILDVAVKVAKQDWEGLAIKAIEFTIDLSIDAMVQQETAELKEKLASAQVELRSLDIKAHEKGIEAARFGVSEALTALETALLKVDHARDQLAELQTNAEDALNRSKDTAIIAQMLQQRTKQQKAIANARALCEHYIQDVGAVGQMLPPISRQYSIMGSWLDEAAAADPIFKRDDFYAKILDLSSISNAVELGSWMNWLEHAAAAAKKAIKTLDDPSAKGPMGPFDEAVKVARSGLTN